MAGKILQEHSRCILTRHMDVNPIFASSETTSTSTPSASTAPPPPPHPPPAQPPEPHPPPEPQAAPPVAHPPAPLTHQVVSECPATPALVTHGCTPAVTAIDNTCTCKAS